MAAYIVWTCAANGVNVAEVGAPTTPRERPTCAAGQGKFVAIEQHPEFDPSQLNAQSAGAAFSAGFTFMATGLVVVQAARALLRAFK